MQKKSLYLFTAFTIAMAATPAWSAGPAMGRISYIYPDGRHIIIDSRDEYTLAPNVDSSVLGVAQFVQLTLGKDNVVTRVSPGPAFLAAYWAPKDIQS